MEVQRLVSTVQELGGLRAGTGIHVTRNPKPLPLPLHSFPSGQWETEAREDKSGIECGLKYRQCTGARTTGRVRFNIQDCPKTRLLMGVIQQILLSLTAMLSERLGIGLNSELNHLALIS